MFPYVTCKCSPDFLVIEIQFTIKFLYLKRKRTSTLLVHLHSFQILLWIKQFTRYHRTNNVHSNHELLVMSSNVSLTWYTGNKFARTKTLKKIQFIFVLCCIKTPNFTNPVGWGCRKHRLHLCSGVSLPQRVSWLFHETIWYWGFSNATAFGKVVETFITITLRSILPQRNRAWLGPINGPNRTVCWRQLHKNAASNIEQVLEVVPHKAAAVRTPTTS